MVTNSNLTRFGLTTFWKTATLSRDYAWMNLNQFKLQKYFDRFFRYLEYDTSLLYSHNSVLFRNNKIYISLKLVDTSILPYRRILDDFNWLNRRKNKIRTFRYFKLSVARLKGFRKVRKRYGLIYKLNSPFFLNSHGLRFLKNNCLKANLIKLERLALINDFCQFPLKTSKHLILRPHNELRSLSNLDILRSTNRGKQVLSSLFFNRLFLRSKIYRKNKMFVNFDKFKPSQHLTQKISVAKFKRKRNNRFYRIKFRKFLTRLAAKVNEKPLVKKSLLRRSKFRLVKQKTIFSRLFPLAKIADINTNFQDYLNILPRSQLKPVYNFYHNPSLKITAFSSNKLEAIFANFFSVFLRSRFNISRLVSYKRFIKNNFIKRRLFNFLPRVPIKISKARILKRKFFRNWKFKNSRKNFKRSKIRPFNKYKKKPFQFFRRNKFRTHFVDYNAKFIRNWRRVTRLFPEIFSSNLFGTTVLTAMLRRHARSRLPFWLIKKRKSRTKHISSTKANLKYRIDNSFRRFIVKPSNFTLNKPVTYSKIINFRNFYYLMRKSIFSVDKPYLAKAFKDVGTTSEYFFNKRLLKIEALNKKFTTSASIEANIFGGKIIPSLEIARFKKNKLISKFSYVLKSKISKFWLRNNRHELKKINDNLVRYNTAFGLEDRRFKFNKFKKNKFFLNKFTPKSNKFKFGGYKKPFKNRYNSNKFVNKNSQFFNRNFYYNKNAKKNNFAPQQKPFYKNKQKTYIQKNSGFKSFQITKKQNYSKEQNFFKKKSFKKKN